MRKVICIFILSFFIIPLKAQKVFTSYLWHLQQPIYWPEKGQSNPRHYQLVKESQDVKNSGGNNYGTGTSHPTNNLEEIFSKADRVQAYQTSPKESVDLIRNHTNAGAQVNYSGCLIENVNSLANASQWGYSVGWENNFKTARGWKTSGGKPRLDIVGFTFHHALSPLVSQRALRKEIQAHKLIYGNTFGSDPVYSKGYWPAECAFSERIIKVLVEEGFQWSVIANSHLARTLNDYPLKYGTDGCNIDPPNKADKVQTTGNNWWSGQIDGRGGTFAAPYCYQAHKAKYVDPQTGQEYVITVVPMADVLSYKDGYAPMSTDDIVSNILPYSNENHPSIILLAHDGDNAYAGGYSYYHESVPNFVNAVEGTAGMQATTIQQFLADNPVPENDIVHVEDGAWVNAANDWGHPQFINWLWPLYNSSTYEFDPEAWTEDARNWAVITAIDNYVCTAEDLSGSVDINKIVYPDETASDAEVAWHFYLPALTSGYMYYGTAEDMEVKQTIAGNNAIEYAQKVLDAHPGEDNTPPSVFIPQRFPYNPGGHGFGPVYGYKDHVNSSDFTVWTYAFDISGVQSAVLKYRCDKDGQNPLSDNENETYAGGNGVSSWNDVPMQKKTLNSAYDANNPDIDFFVLPQAIADLYYAKIIGLKDTLVDYYVEVTDTKGNVFKTPIQHVWVGNEDENLPSNSYIYWSPKNPTKNDLITIVDSQATANSFLHWGVNNWNAPITEYQPEGTELVDQQAVETPFTDPDGDGVYSVVLGPFNNADQIVETVNFVIKLDDNTWDNNNGADYAINIQSNVSDNPVGSNQTFTMYMDSAYTFKPEDFYFYSPINANFSGIRVMSGVDAGSLTYNNVEITDSIDCSNLSLLKFIPASGEIGEPYTHFTFKVMDDSGLVSNGIYTATINVYDLNPIGENSSVTIIKNNSYSFSLANFPFTGKDGADFKGIKIISTVEKGTLEYNLSDVLEGEECNDVSLLTFTPATDEVGSPYTSFSYKLVDTENRLSTDTYTMTINVIENYPDGVSWQPENPTEKDQITITVANDAHMSTSAYLHWGVNNWSLPIEAYRPAGTTLFNGTGPAVQTHFNKQSENVYTVTLGPFDNPSQVVNSLNFVLHYGNDSWNNNNGEDWEIQISHSQPEMIHNSYEQMVNIYPNPLINYSTVDMTGLKGNYSISLIDMTGKVLANAKVVAPLKFTIKKGVLKTGIYILRFKDENQNKIFSKTLLVH